MFIRVGGKIKKEMNYNTNMKGKEISYRKSREVSERKIRETNREGINEEEK